MAPRRPPRDGPELAFRRRVLNRFHRAGLLDRPRSTRLAPRGPLSPELRADALEHLAKKSPELSELRTALAASGHHFVEAPLTGGAIGARNRALVFMVGGEPEPVARVTPLLDALGRATVHLGPVGTGSTMKLVNSLLAFTCTWASLEGLSLAAAAGIDLRAAVEVVRTGGASNFYIDRAVEGIGNRGQPPQFALALAAKDAGLIREAAAASGVPSAMADASRKMLPVAL